MEMQPTYRDAPQAIQHPNGVTKGNKEHIKVCHYRHLWWFMELRVYERHGKHANYACLA